MVRNDHVRRSEVAALFNLSKRTLARYVEKLTDEEVNGDSQVSTTYKGYFKKTVS